ncbi:hypothetical protein GALMADRAFT_210206 [Galerina marginata CBS 339.88]|uniref:Uncharacterized protein n=1 Tax=Galerina marginata (strain CBS 339.88) TaxID=685588 RepID=A0A067TDJ7_GALM3|nr:hypothetical protein GALMADRAFT_210206 [Galerina marginata CBS 339.88]
MLGIMLYGFYFQVRPPFPFKNIPPAAPPDPDPDPRPTEHVPPTPLAQQADDNMEYDGDDEEGLDPRVRLRSPPNRRSKSDQEKLLHAIVRSYLVHKSLLPKSDEDVGEENHGITHDGTTLPTLPKPPCSPDPAVVAAYQKLLHPGPSRQDPLLLWSKPLTHAWNRQVVTILSKDFVEYAKEKQLVKLVILLGDNVQNPDSIPDKIAEIGSIKQLISSKLDARRMILQKIARRVDAMTDKSMSTAEIAATLEEKRISAKVRSRRSERRKVRFVRRFDIIDEKLHSLAVLQDPEALTFWQSIQKFYALFGPADASSDETEREATNLVSKRVRRKRGSAPLARILQSVNVDRTAKPHPQLPVNIYSPEISPQARKALQAKAPVAIPQVPKVRYDIPMVI